MKKTPLDTFPHATVPKYILGQLKKIGKTPCCELVLGIERDIYFQAASGNNSSGPFSIPKDESKMIVAHLRKLKYKVSVKKDAGYCKIQVKW